MGLFFSEAGITARQTVSADKRRVLKIASYADRLNCSHCSLDRERLHHPKMPPTGADHPVLYFLGEAPGRAEDEEGVQFVGESGKVLRARIPPEWEDAIRFNNVLRCRPPNNRDPSGLEISCCHNLQVADIEAAQPEAIAGFGNHPLAWLIGPGQKISDWRGRRVPVKVGKHVCWFYPMVHPAFHLWNEDRKKGEAHMACFERDMARMFAEVEQGLPQAYVEEPADYGKGIICLTEYGQDGLRAVEQRLLSLKDRDHAHDIETNMLRPYSPGSKILTMSSGTYDEAFAFALEHKEARWSPKEKHRLYEIIEAYFLGNGRKWAHNLRFEQEWWARKYGLKTLYAGLWGDTMAQAHALDERRGKSLDNLTLLYFGFVLKSIYDLDRERMEQYPLSLILPYNATDVKYTDPLSHIQAELLEQLGLSHVHERFDEMSLPLVAMQARGLVRNEPAIAKLDKDLSQKKEKALSRIMSNSDVRAFMDAGNKFKPTSDPNIAAFFHHVGEHADSYDEEALSIIKHPVADLVMSLRTLNKNHGYVTPLLSGGKYVHGDGLVHFSSSHLITFSGRLQAEDPNIQNYPRREHKEIREVYRAPKDD